MSRNTDTENRHAKRAAGGEMSMSMAEVFVMHDGTNAERRALVTALNENEIW